MNTEKCLAFVVNAMPIDDYKLTAFTNAAVNGMDYALTKGFTVIVRADPVTVESLVFKQYFQNKKGKIVLLPLIASNEDQTRFNEKNVWSKNFHDPEHVFETYKPVASFLLGKEDVLNEEIIQSLPNVDLFVRLIDNKPFDQLPHAQNLLDYTTENFSATSMSNVDNAELEAKIFYRILKLLENYEKLVE